jgi:hypothetical protein
MTRAEALRRISARSFDRDYSTTIRAYERIAARPVIHRPNRQNVPGVSAAKVAGRGIVDRQIDNPYLCVLQVGTWHLWARTRHGPRCSKADINKVQKRGENLGPLLKAFARWTPLVCARAVLAVGPAIAIAAFRGGAAERLWMSPRNPTREELLRWADKDEEMPSTSKR